LSESYSIGDLSREFGVTTRAIRFYEDQGLLKPQREGQNRVYTNRERVRLKLIMRGKRLGFSLREAAELLQMYDAPDGEHSQLLNFIDRIQARRVDLVRQSQEIDAVLHELDDLENRCLEVLGEESTL
jgi:DNA-binding transcriptional MerR regulator